MQIEMTIPLTPRTKKNHPQMFKDKRTGKLKPVPSKAFLEYQDAAGWYITHKWERISTPIGVKCVFYLDSQPNANKTDLNNLLEAATDVLTHYGVILDDCSKIVCHHDGSRVLWDHEHPRTEITIMEYVPTFNLVGAEEPRVYTDIGGKNVRQNETEM